MIPDRGNFIATFGRNVPGDQLLAETLQQNWNQINHRDNKIRFENFKMENIKSQVEFYFNILSLKTVVHLYCFSLVTCLSWLTT